MRNWDDERILNYLMTSDFNDSVSPEDMKYLLSKFRYFYRIVSSKSMNIEVEKRNFEFEIDHLKKTKDAEIQNLNNINQDVTSKYKHITSTSKNDSIQVECFFIEIKKQLFLPFPLIICSLCQCIFPAEIIKFTILQ